MLSSVAYMISGIIGIKTPATKNPVIESPVKVRPRFSRLKRDMAAPIIAMAVPITILLPKHSLRGPDSPEPIVNEKAIRANPRPELS